MFKYIFVMVVFVYIYTVRFKQREYDLQFYVKRDCLLFSLNVKLFSEFFVMPEKANYVCVKVFSEEVHIQGTLKKCGFDIPISIFKASDWCFTATRSHKTHQTNQKPVQKMSKSQSGGHGLTQLLTVTAYNHIASIHKSFSGI